MTQQDSVDECLREAGKRYIVIRGEEVPRVSLAVDDYLASLPFNVAKEIDRNKIYREIDELGLAKNPSLIKVGVYLASSSGIEVDYSQLRKSFVENGLSWALKKS